MNVTYQLNEEEFDYQLFCRIKAQFARRHNPLKIKIEEAEVEETDAIKANPAFYHSTN
jgi:hypothetical protein